MDINGKLDPGGEHIFIIKEKNRLIFHFRQEE